MMPTATDRSKTDCTHRKILKNNLIGKKKKLQEENDKIDRILRSSAYTEEEKGRHFQQRERNLKEITKFKDEINKIDNELFSPTGNNPVTRGRSRTRGPNLRYASPSPIKRSPRSASSSVPRRRSDQTDEDKLRKMQDQLEQSRKENELLRGELSEERHKIQKIASKLQGEYEVVIFDLKLEITSLIEELKEKEAALTKLENVDIPHLQQERDEYKDSAAQIKQKLRQEMNMQLEDSEIRSRQKVAEFEETLRAYEVENETLRNENSETMEQYKSLRFFFSQRKDYYNKITEKAEENNAILHERLNIEVEEKERIQRENITLKTQIDSSSRENEWSRKNDLEKLGKLQKENDRLKENLELIQKAYQRERGNVTTLQQKETEMRQKISEIKRRNQNLENKKKEEKDSILTKREHEKEIIRLHSVVRDKDLEEAKLRNKIEDLEKKNNEIQSRTDKRLRDIEENERKSKQLKEENDKELKRLRQLEINYKSEADVLRSNQTDLENKVQHLQAEKELFQRNGETERRAAEELQRVLYAEKRNSNELRDRIKDLERSKELDIHYKSEAEVLKSNHTDLEKKVQHLQAEKKRLQRNGEMEGKVAEELRCDLDSEKRKSDDLRDRIKDLERLLRIEEKGREQLKQDSDKELNRLRQLEINYKTEKETLESNHTDLEKKVKQLQDEKEMLLQNEKSERKIADKLKRELDAEKRDSNKLRERMKDLERESTEKIETGRKQVLDGKDRELIRLRRSENDYKNKTDTLKHELADLRRDFALLQEEKDELIESEKTEMKKAKGVQKELDDARREEVKFRDRIKELERHMTVPKVDPSMSAENSRLKEDLKHLGIELKNAQERIAENGESVRHYMKQVEALQREKRQAIAEKESALARLTQLEINNKIEAASRNSNQTALEKKVKRLQDEKDRLLQNEEMKRKVAEKIKSELGDRDLERERFQQKEKLGTERKQESVEKERELIRLRGLESIYKNETDTLKHELADLKKKIELLQEEKEELVESEETERKIAETVQNELDDAKRETLMLQDRIKELQRQMKSFPKVDPSMAEENSRLKEDHKHLGIELQKAQQKITENEESVRHYMRQVETLQREKQQAIAEKESALTRLSALAGDRLRDNNAAIADLSDENRPINLGEKFSELYDNQWTDAIEKLEKLMTERDAIQKLLSMIQDIYCVCEDIAKKQLDLIAKEFGLEGRKEKLKRLKDFRKSMAPDNLQDIKERVNSSCVAKDFSEEAAYCASYINRSVELCWYMCIQDPPVVLEFKASHGDVFNDKIYRHFTKSGRTIDYMVWPVMYLHSNGPLLQKGVVQPV